MDETGLVREDDGLGGFVFAGFVPALLLFLLWTLVTGVVLLRRTWAAATQVAFA